MESMKQPSSRPLVCILQSLELCNHHLQKNCSGLHVVITLYVYHVLQLQEKVLLLHNQTTFFSFYILLTCRHLKLKVPTNLILSIPLSLTKHESPLAFSILLLGLSTQALVFVTSLSLSTSYFVTEHCQLVLPSKFLQKADQRQRELWSKNCWF